jgi:single-strand DNA-binding protein
MNVWNFTGNLGRDAEVRYTAGGDAITSFSVAVKSGYGEREQTTWANCTMWGDRGTKVQPYLTKGQLVGVSGEVCLRSYDKDGETRWTLDVRVNDVTLLGKKQDQAPQQQGFRDTNQQQDNGAPF